MKIYFPGPLSLVVLFMRKGIRWGLAESSYHHQLLRFDASTVSKLLLSWDPLATFTRSIIIQHVQIHIIATKKNPPKTNEGIWWITVIETMIRQHDMTILQLSYYWDYELHIFIEY